MVVLVVVLNGGISVAASPAVAIEVVICWNGEVSIVVVLATRLITNIKAMLHKVVICAPSPITCIWQLAWFTNWKKVAKPLRPTSCVRSYIMYTYIRSYVRTTYVYVDTVDPHFLASVPSSSSPLVDNRTIFWYNYVLSYIIMYIINFSMLLA